MNEGYQIINVGKPTDPVWNAVGMGLHSYNIQHAGDANDKSICFVIRDSNEEIVGGLIGRTHWGWFYLDLFFLKEELRGQGYGHRILTLAEEEAKNCGATNVYLDTFSFQAPDFYLKHGYHVFGELKDFPAGHTRYYMTKKL